MQYAFITFIKLDNNHSMRVGQTPSTQSHVKYVFMFTLYSPNHPLSINGHSHSINGWNHSDQCLFIYIFLSINKQNHFDFWSSNKLVLKKVHRYNY